MATGDITWFDQALVDLANKEIDLGADTIKLALITSATTPAATTANPTYGAAGTNMSTNAVATGTAWTGPVTLASVTATLSGGKFVFDSADPSQIAQDAGGFTDARWGIIYDDTHASKLCVAYLDLGTDRSIVSGPLTITWNAGGILTIDQA